MKFDTFKWSDELSIGVTAMDNQHKVLIDKINTLIDDLSEDSPNSHKDFQALAGYVVEHFNDEEKYMESIGFPGLPIHKNIHKQLLEKVGEFDEDIRIGTVDKMKLISFLKMWLKSHIMGIDMKYGDFSQEKSA
ncbi:MAG: bacteriohemerythrin [Bacteriovoracaceae bacterium]|nr:bacteriohemerythrin [Bacteriovoracaceae bacterium]